MPMWSSAALVAGMPRGRAGGRVLGLTLALSLVGVHELAAAPPDMGGPPVARATLEPPRPVATEPPRLSLVGTIAGQSDGVAVEGIAILVDQTTREVLHLKPGDRYAGWTLQSIKRGSAVLDDGQRSEILTLLGPDQVAVQQVAPAATEPAAGDGGPDSIPRIEPAPLPDALVAGAQR